MACGQRGRNDGDHEHGVACLWHQPWHQRIDGIPRRPPGALCHGGKTRKNPLPLHSPHSLYPQTLSHPTVPVTGSAGGERRWTWSESRWSIQRGYEDKVMLCFGVLGPGHGCVVIMCRIGGDWNTTGNGEFAYRLNTWLPRAWHHATTRPREPLLRELVCQLEALVCHAGAGLSCTSSGQWLQCRRWLSETPS